MSIRKPPNILMEGYLTKRSVNKKFGLAYIWQDRYFLLDDLRSLTYYKSENGTIRGQIVLTFDTRVMLSELRPHSFQIITSYVTMHLQAGSDLERDAWISVIQNQVKIASNEKKTKTWDRIKKKAQEVKQAKKTGYGTHEFEASGQKFEIDSRYEFKRPIGRGAYGVVVAAVDHKDGTNVAIKKIKNVFDNVIDGKRILREVTLLRHLKHKNISHIIDIMKPPLHKEFNDVYIVMDLMDTDLHRVIYSTQKLTDQHIQFLMFQLLSACAYLQSANVIHRDLKPSNILVNSACALRICDFGLARGLDQEVAGDPVTVYVVTRWYRAPELLLSSKEYDSAIDMWSVGCIFAELIGRKPLFPGDDYLRQLELICDALGSPSDEDLEFVTEPAAAKFVREMGHKERVPWKELSQLSDGTEDALDLLDKMLTFNPSKRITAIEALEHPYLKLYAAQPQQLCEETINVEDVESINMTEDDIRKAINSEIDIYRPNYYETLAKQKAQAS